MISYLEVSNGKSKKGDKTDYRLSEKGLLWIFLMEPTESEITKVSSDFKLEKRLFQIYWKEKHSVRYSMDPFEFVMVDYFIEDEKIGSSHLLFIIKENLLILVSSKASKFYNELFNNINDNIEKNKIPSKNIGRILHAFLQEDVEGNYDVLEKTEQEISAIEEKTANFETAKNINIKDIIRLKRKLFMMGRRFWASTKIIFLLKAGFTNVKLDPDTSKLLVDVHDTFLHQIDIVTAQKEMLSDVLSIYSTSINNRLALVSNELNQIMKKLSSFALILLLPTLIASVYGMNFETIPFLQNPYGFHMIMASMGVVTVLLVFLFKKRGWL